MTRRPLPIRVAALVAALALLLTACDPQTSGAPEEGMTWSITFDHVNNLVPGHAVRVADVIVGTVTSIDLTEDLRAEVTVVVEDDLRAPEGTVAIIRKTSLLGEDFVALVFPEGADPANGPVLADGAELAVGVGVSTVEELTEKAIRVLGAVAADDLDSLVTNGLEIVDGREGQLRDLIADVSTVTSTYAAQTDRITAVADGLGDIGGELAEGRDDLADAVDSLGEAAALAAEQRERVVSAFSSLERLQLALDGGPLGDRADDLDRLLAEMVPVTQGLAEDRDQLITLLQDFRGFADRVDEAVNDGKLELYIVLTLTLGGQPISDEDAITGLLGPAS